MQLRVERPISGASDWNGASSPPEHIWVALNTSEATWCEGCGKAIPVRDPMYTIVVDGRETRLGSACGRRYMERWCEEHATHLAPKSF
jgi:hypothetical protein